ncbi:BQ2448_409 [Microbotryum intermedium]|uniref:BQ2448_409 protein n=1 Tax=Microbotryum intermedium TaxID=269621 RepID=A0A238FAX8_9BASI|nr:BQ2448_409 [Microbotryum intermedium]
MSTWSRPLTNPSHGGAYHAYANPPMRSSLLSSSSGQGGGLRKRISHATSWKTLMLVVFALLLWIAPSPLGPPRRPLAAQAPPPSFPDDLDLGAEPLDRTSPEQSPPPPTAPPAKSPSLSQIETCPVCSPTDDLCAKWGSQVLLRSRMYRGTLHRFGPFFDKLAKGEDLKIGLLGGSISACVDLEKKDCYDNRLAKALAEEWGVKVEIFNGALSGMGSMFFESCWAAHFSSPVDLMLVDVSVNDVMNPTMNPSFDALLRSLLGQKPSMAVLVLTLFSPLIGWRDGSAQVESIAQYYDVPVLSQKNVIIHHRRMNPPPEILTIKDTEATTEFDQWYNRANGAEAEDGSKTPIVAFPTGHHPGPKGHVMIADLITSFLRHERCVFERDRGVEEVRGAVTMREFELPTKEIPEWNAYTPIDGPKASFIPSLTCYSATPSSANPFRILSQRGGWTATHWKNKYYLMASQPGAHIVFEVEVPASAIVQLMYWRSNTVPLGSAMAWFDDEDDQIEMLRGKWAETATVPALARFILDPKWVGKRRKFHVLVMDHTETGSNEFRISTLIY